MFRIAKQFTFDAGHRLVSHPERCRHLHGHTYRLEVILESPALDTNGMVCDYQVVSNVVRSVVAPLDHAVILWHQDPLCETLKTAGEKVVALAAEPTAEALAQYLFLGVARALQEAVGKPERVAPYRIHPELRLARVRLWETPKTWAEYSEE